MTQIADIKIFNKQNNSKKMQTYIQKLTISTYFVNKRKQGIDIHYFISIHNKKPKIIFDYNNMSALN